MWNGYLILDGYNVINLWPRLKSLMSHSLELARDELINIMAEFRAFKGINVVIVFDAHLKKGNTGVSEEINGVEVVFTKECETADCYIEKLTIELLKNHNVAVVTNDKTEQQMILGSGAIRIPVREMIGEFKQMKNKINAEIRVRGIQKNTLSDMIDNSILERLERFRCRR